MLQVYDRVISSGSQITLLMLTIVLLVAFVALAGLDAVRARVLTRASIRLDRLVAGRVMTAVIDRAAAFGGARSQLLRALNGRDDVRCFSDVTEAEAWLFGAWQAAPMPRLAMRA